MEGWVSGRRRLEHPGWTRGTPGSIPWKVGFSDAGGYKTHERRKKLEQDQLQALHERVMGLEDREEEREAADRSKRPVEASPEATPPSQRRSSVASTELPQLEHAAPASYPVDAITESQHCHLMAEWQNFKVKAAVGSVLPTEPGATYHCRPMSRRLLALFYLLNPAQPTTAGRFQKDMLG